VNVPAFRQDLDLPVDLYEELARGIGYDRISSTLPLLEPSVSGCISRYSRLRALKQRVAALGLVETMSWALVSEGDLSQFGFTGPGNGAARLINPLNQDFAFLRPTLAIGLARSAAHNLVRGASSVRLFELAAVVKPDAVPPANREQVWLGIALAGDWSRDWRLRRTADFNLLKGLLESLFLGVEGEALCFKRAGASIAWAEHERQARIFLGDSNDPASQIGFCGQLSRAIAKPMDIDADVWIAELKADALLAPKRAETVSESASFPAVKRDLSIVLQQSVPYDGVEQAIREAGTERLHHLALIDRYAKGESLASGTYSLTFSLAYRHPSRTLTAEEADAAHQAIVRRLKEQFAAVLR
jgi:phenylalanyl-tRNA synthetase beta chain